MSEDERPRKLPKLADDNDEATDRELGPAMTGAVHVDDDRAQTGAVGASNTHFETLGNADDRLTETSESTVKPHTEDGAPQMSKNQLKKLLRRQKWAEDRESRKDKRKEMAAKKKERRNIMVQEARETGGEEAVKELRKRWEGTRAKAKRSTPLPLSIVIDCGYDDLMTDKERISLASQLTRSYSENTRAPWRANLMFSSFDKLLKERFDTVLAAHKNWKNITIIQEDFVEAAELAKAQMASPQGGKFVGPFADCTDAKPEDGEVIYLSSDSENTLTELKPYNTYIIGGLVDKNRHKAVCYKAAVEKGIKTAKLPIGDYIKMASRSVLTTNHVVDIMLNWLQLGDWGEAFMRILPQRKGGQLKEKTGGNDGGEDAIAEEDEDGDADVAALEVVADENEGDDAEHEP
ncbi:tRNA (guanine(9)-N(1))-methyltransferase TRM10 [Penicillium argentinense]|uniref:tRNA (guanine(9)-N1)-methyltransferase n=1 Tax=Penicillium argentinense TaxID=1131581 RepID=A0A9W9G3C0_9EURO|nr:tRNA (guanine(9)-N(1))-methyltransferase TRM10 [Penicillium argentinense]KAJ5111282.1 tRNA (guanine(9)-N(1))-methyltransferase TRM10 [Penicillium argentinense]